MTCKDTALSPPGPARAARTAEGTGTRAGTNRAPQDPAAKESSKQEQGLGHSGRDAPRGQRLCLHPCIPSPQPLLSFLTPGPPSGAFRTSRAPPGQHSPALGAGRGLLIAYVPSGRSSQGCCILRHYCINIYIYIYISSIYILPWEHARAGRRLCCASEGVQPGEGGRSPAPHTGDSE